MTNAAALHPVFQAQEAHTPLRLMTADELQEVDGGWLREAVSAGRIGFMLGGVVGAAVAAALVGGVVYAVTH